MNCLIEVLAKTIKVKFNLGFLLKKKSTKKKISIEHILIMLKNMGIQKGDTIMIHSSMSYVDAKAEDFIESLKNLVGEEGNILMPTHPILDKNKDGVLVYNPNTSKSTVGYLTECFRKMPDVERSLHPFSSIAVWGKDKKLFLDGNTKNISSLPHGIDSPYYKFAQKHGKTICIGVTAKNRATIKHVAEELLDKDLPQDIFEEVDVFLENTNSIKKFRRTILSFSMIYMCKSKIEKDWIKWNILQKNTIETIPIEVLDASKCVTLMKKNISQGSTHYPFSPKSFLRD